MIAVLRSLTSHIAEGAHLETSFAGHGLACRRGERLVFSGLDFAMKASGALVLTGPNGSGKSSLLRLMAGLTPPTEGDLSWGGETITEDPVEHRRRLHFVGHADALKPPLTVGETLAFWAGMRGSDAVEDALDRFRLRALARLPCRLLSAGQRRRVSLGRLVASRAALWLLDEPLTGLDEESIGDLYEAIEDHRAVGGLIVLSTHAPLALEAADSLSLADYATGSEPA